MPWERLDGYGGKNDLYGSKDIPVDWQKRQSSKLEEA